nr:unnamed protein product [Callosobruchus chinensis]
MYHQMKNDGSIFKFDEQSRKFTLNPNAKFHFFTTHVPCGDAAIFPKQDPEDFGDLIQQKEDKSPPNLVEIPDVDFTAEKITEESSEVPLKKMKLMVEDGTMCDSGIKMAADIHRTGAKCLQQDEKQDPKMPGSAYHIVGCVRTKPGRGTPTLSVSCSDKLSKWCHMGLQGALLSLLLDKPLYVSSFTIAGKTPFCREALKRALFDRLGEVTLGHPYAPSNLIIGQSNIGFEFSKSGDRRPCSSCIAWSQVPSQSLEVAVDGKRQGVVKKKQNTSIARLKICKVELLKVFKEVCEVRKIDIPQQGDATYGNFKKLSTNYQSAWTSLRNCFKTWTVKNKNLLEFCSE